MFCQTCQRDEQGRFCSNCGTRLPEPTRSAEGEDVLTLADVVADWQDEVRYEELLKYAEVRQAIEHEQRQAPWRLSGEQFLSVADKLAPQVISLEGAAVVAQLFFTRLGVKTDKQRGLHLAAPVGEAIARSARSRVVGRKLSASLRRRTAA